MKVLKILGLIFLLLIIVVAASMFYFSRGLDEVLNISINPIDLTDVEDGIYKGRYEYGRWTNELNVTVNSQKITRIDIEKDVKIVQPELSSQLFERVIEKQNTTVDAVSGGTVTCKAYLKSIENALNK
jgi:uncharacterized protein with FMN-binding domain